MRTVLRDLLVSRGLRPEWLNPARTIAGIELRRGGSAFVPYSFSSRLFNPSRQLTISDFFLASEIRIAFSETLRYKPAFLRMVEGCRSQVACVPKVSKEFPWGRFLRVRFQWAILEPYRHERYDLLRSWQPDHCEHLVVIDEANGRRWRMEIRALRWVGLESIEYAES